MLVVGVGALGCPAATALAHDGNFDITLLDEDLVELSNLQRQPLFDDHDIGRSKCEAAAEALRSLYPRGVFRPKNAMLTELNAVDFFRRHDFVIDACDSVPTKFLINRTALRTGTPFCHGGVARSGGQFMSIVPGCSACLSCVFDEDSQAPGEGCSELGILAPVAGVVGSLQAFEAVKALTIPRSFVAGRMMIFNLKGKRWRRVDFPKSENCRCSDLDADRFVSRRQPECHL